MPGWTEAMRFFRRLWVALALLLLAVGPAAADGPLHGVALVIGESRYGNGWPALDNPRNDARAMDDLLSDLGFDVTRVLDGDEDKLQREIDGFVEDAADADVALVYYSGHGIEAGGQNYLVPLDADISTPERAGQTLIALQPLLDRLAKAVPISIVLLDACRTNGLPTGTMIQPPGAEAPVVATETGLAAVRGPAPVLAPTSKADGLGEVIGFAASPGQSALDGDPDGNSPYAAALLKHLAAGGYSFGDVMTMVTEEVYLKTRAKQLPWVNSSLRRVLTFSAPQAPDDPDTAAIQQGRRQLLLNIAGAPDSTRQYVEQVASSEGVPLDALYGMLNVLGVDTSGGAQDLEKQLLEGARQLKAYMEETPGGVKSDPELVRLSGLADEAQQEGAMALALKFREQATARARALSAERDTLEDQLKQDRLEIAATYGEHAETAALNFDYRTAAEMFGEAYEQVKRWDDGAALHYKWNEAQALKSDGDMRGVNPPLTAAIEAYGTALELAPRDKDATDWAGLQNNVGNVYLTLAERSGDGATLQQAIDAFHAALDVSQRDTAPEDWAMTQNNLGIALVDRSYAESGRESLDAAVAAFEAALTVRTREALPLDWATTQNNLAIALKTLGDRTHDVSLTQQALDGFRAVLGVYTQAEAPLDWAMTQSNMGNALSTLGKADPRSGALDEAVAAYHAALEEYREDRTPLDWAMTQSNLAVALREIGYRDGDMKQVAAAADIYREVLASLDRQTAPQFWAMTQNNLAVALGDMASQLQYPEAAQGEIDAYRAALEVYTAQANPAEWLSAQTGLANALTTLAFLKNDDVALLRQSVAAHRVAIAAIDAGAAPGYWALLHQSLALALDALSDVTRDAGVLDEAIADATLARDYYVGQGEAADAYDGWIGGMKSRRAAMGP